MTRRVFTTYGWNDTSSEPVDLDVIDGVQTISYLTIDKAVAACVAGDVVEPCRPGMPGFAFTDADGLPLKTVVVPLGAHWTIDKAITLQGGWCRLRLDCGGNKRVVIERSALIYDVDFLAAYGDYYGSLSLSSPYYQSDSFHFTRCCFLGFVNSSQDVRKDYGSATFTDCAFIGGRYGDFYKSLNGNNISLIRCTFNGYQGTAPSTSDVVNYSGKSQATLNATFVKPPQIGATWTANDWQNIDLRLLPSSQYATGATSVQSGQTVYDVAGVKRKVGGALGAYEVLDDAPTHYWGGSNLRYTVDYEDDSAPRCSPILGGDGTVLNTNVASAEPKRVETRAAGSQTWAVKQTSDTARTRTIGASTAGYRTAFVDSDGNVTSGWTTITKCEESDVSTSGAVPAASFNVKSGWRNRDGSNASAAPTSGSVAYIDKNVRFVDDSTQKCGKVYQEGFVHTDLGGAEGEIILGDRSTAKTCGKLTWSDQTTTSAEALARVVPRAPAELTFKECAITAESWSNPSGTKIIFDDGSISGVLPTSSVLANGVEAFITSNNTVDYLGIIGSVSVDVDSEKFLSVTTSLDLTDTTGVVLESTGYVAVPAGTTTSLFTAGESGSIDRLCFYGAGVESISAVIAVQTASITVEKTTPSIPVLTERKLNGSWVVVGNDVFTCNVSDDDKSIVFRTFDGVNFTESQPTRRTYYLKNRNGGSFSTASDWTLDASRSVVCSSAPQISGNVFDCRF